MDVDNKPTANKPNARVVIITNLSRNVVETHLKTIFGFYGEIVQIDLPVFGKCTFSYLPLH
jgi:RNA recognition motif-containing protein